MPQILTDSMTSEALALLRLYQDWGVDCALDESPVDRMAEPPPIPRAFSRKATRPAATASKPAASPIVATQASLTQAQDLAALARSLPDLPGCALARTATHTLLPIHVEGAALMLIGETPDADEDRSGLLFAGPSGQLLDRMFASIGLSRETMSQAPALPWRPPGGRDVTLVEMRACRPVLHRAIALCRPQRLITLGATPTRLLLGEDSVLTRVRGRWAESTLEDGTVLPVLPMRHPLQLPASATARRDAWRDLLLLAETLAPSGAS
ncbi:uracil-DNA glycosylase [Kozakia baliensis]|uniref:uracil-DNA glycosylase n=1 Tax=Kozakia baliensis TaxID=153496 RepID=UPI000569142B|nr:uracil-DNA glycosylase [Kozakia baliensis]